MQRTDDRYIQRAVYLHFNFNTFAVSKYSMLAHLESIPRLHNAALDLLELFDLDIYMESVIAHLT
jgi:hypothetical protein